LWCWWWFQVGNLVKVLFDDGQWYHGSVTEFDPVGNRIVLHPLSRHFSIHFVWRWSQP
jgi:hypothetical protein